MSAGRDGNGLGPLPRLVWSGVFRPREAMARLMELRPGLDAAILMVLLAYLVSAVFSLVMPTPEGAEVRASRFSLHLQGLIIEFGSFFAAAGIATWLGRAAGGTAWFPQVAAAVGFGFLLQAMLTPGIVLAFSLIVAQAMWAGAVLLLLGLAAWSIWLLASCIAEVHGFRSTIAVAGAVFGFAIAFGLLAMIFIIGSAIGGR